MVLERNVLIANTHEVSGHCCFFFFFFAKKSCFQSRGVSLPLTRCLIQRSLWAGCERMPHVSVCVESPTLRASSLNAHPLEAGWPLGFVGWGWGVKEWRRGALITGQNVFLLFLLCFEMLYPSLLSEQAVFSRMSAKTILFTWNPHYSFLCLKNLGDMCAEIAMAMLPGQVLHYRTTKGHFWLCLWHLLAFLYFCWPLENTWKIILK